MLNNTMVDETHKLQVHICFEDGSAHHIYHFPHREHNENTFVLDITDVLSYNMY
jgi:hypothetical protein